MQCLYPGKLWRWKSYIDLFELDSASGITFDCHFETKDGAKSS